MNSHNPGVRKTTCTFFCWNVETWENIFFVHLAKVGEWKQHGMNAGPQSSMSGMCWREPETRPNPHSRLQRIQAPAYMQKKCLHVHNHPRKLLMLLQNIQKVDSIYPVVEKVSQERYSNECLHPSAKRDGGSVIVFIVFCFSVSDVGNLVQADGRINAEKYCQIVIHHVIPTKKHLISTALLLTTTITQKTIPMQ